MGVGLVWGSQGTGRFSPSSSLHILEGELSLSLSYLYPPSFLCLLSWTQVHHSMGEDWRSGVQCSLPRPCTGVHTEEYFSRQVSSCVKAVHIHTNLCCTVAAFNPDAASERCSGVHSAPLCTIEVGHAAAAM